MIEIFLDGGEWMKRQYDAGRTRVESTQLTSRVAAIDVMRSLSSGPTRELVVVVGPSWLQEAAS